MPDTLPPRSQSKNKRTSLTYNGFSGRVQDPEHHAPLSTAVASPAGVGDVLRPDDLMLYEQQLAARMDRGETVSDEDLDLLEALRRGEPMPALTQAEILPQGQLKSTSELILNERASTGDHLEHYDEYDYDYDEEKKTDLEAEPEQLEGSDPDPIDAYAPEKPELLPWPSEVPWRAVRPLPAGDHYTERVLRTHRLPVDVAAALDSLDELCKINLRLRINLSDIVATAITMAIKDVAEHGIHSLLLRTMLGPLYDQLAGLQSESIPELTPKLKSNLQTILNSDLISPLKSDLKSASIIDSNHPSSINLHNQERDDSSRSGSGPSILKAELKSNSTYQPNGAPIQDTPRLLRTSGTPTLPISARSEDLQRWQIFITDFEREIPGNPAGNKPATAGQFESIRQEAGVSVEEFATAVYEARERYRRADKAKLRTHWSYLMAEIQKILGIWRGGASQPNNSFRG